jgi:hypothetical protein
MESSPAGEWWRYFIAALVVAAPSVPLPLTLLVP